MKVYFLENVPNVAKAWDIKEVKPWYAQNMLFPKKLALEFTDKLEQDIKNKKLKEEKNRLELLNNKNQLFEKLNWKKLIFKLKTWHKDKIYWWIWEKEIISQIKKEFKVELSKKYIDLVSWHIKKLWRSDLYIKISSTSIAKMELLIESE